MPLLKLREYARHRAELRLPGGTHGAVQKAIRTGRIQINADGLIDSDAADQAWAAATNTNKRTSPRPVSAPGREAIEEDEIDGAPAFDPEASTARPGMSLAQAAALEKVWNANLAELKYRKLLGELVGAKDLSDQLAALFTSCRTKLLGVPTTLRQQMPELSLQQLALIDKVIRQALEDLSTSPAEVIASTEEPDDG